MKKILAVLTIATGLLLTGCSQSNEAATIGGFKITQTELQNSIDAVMAERSKVSTADMQLETGQALNRGQLRFKILMHTFDEIAKELKLEVTASQVVNRKSQIIESLGGETNLPKNLVNAAIAQQDFDTYIRAIIISDQITQALTSSGVPEANVAEQLGKLLTAKAKDLGVTVNPRYGTWDEKIGDVVAADATGGAVTPSTK